MKRLILPILLLSSLHAMAQPNLTSANSLPTPGMSTTYNTTDIGTPGSGGANQTWNFATIPNNGNLTTDYITCSAAPDCGVMTGSNVVASSSGTYMYYQNSNSASSIRGMAAGGVVMNFTNPEDMMRFPMTYNTNYSDSFLVSYTSGVPFIRRGNVTVTADGYGTLILPTGTYNNVLRVHRVEEYRDETMGIVMFETVGDQYMWYQAGNHDVILSSVNLTINGTSATKVDVYTATPTSTNDVNMFETALTIFPNPASELVTVSFESRQGNNIGFTLNDLSGRVVAAKE
ncbi:MAG: hypothetical protein EOP49_15670, partial [Sphingobacteriales bacterium]